jgi:amino acid adenylation domain-containing protein
VPLLLRDMLAAYDALRRGGRAALPPRRPFRDFIAWLAQQDTTEAERYWRDVVQSITAPTSLGLDRTGEIAGQASGFRSRVATLSSSSTATLQGFVQRHQLTLNTLVQGAWALLLTRYSGESDVVFGMTVSGRSAPLDGIESMVGLLINTVPIRVSVSPDVTVLSWLKALFVQNAELRLYEHTPLARIQSWSQVPNGRSLFDSLLVFENYPWDATLAEGLSELKVREIEAEDQTNYPLTMTVIPGRELSLRCSYDCTRFEEDDIRGLLGHVTCLLEELAGNPNATLADLSLLAESERHRLQNWNATARAYAHTQCVHELIEEQAERTPGAVALVYKDQRLTYEEVNARANQVAHYLLAHGAGPDVLVGICLERSLDMVIGLLGILKAGSAYVPIDPDYPRERIGFMVQDAAVPLLLTGRDLMSSLGIHQTHIICLDRDRPEIECERRSNPCAPVGLQNLAYTIYTSGSTGRPKGAGIPHGGLLNRLLWMQEQYSLQPDDRVLQKTPFSFDVSVWEFFWPLMAGACLVVAGPGEHRQPDRLVELIVANQVTTLHFVPPMLQAFLETPAVSLCRSIRRVICSGEALPAELQRRFFERLDAELHNLYGPTEASIDVTAWACRRNDAGPSVPIGSPIANTQIHLLDPHGHPVPVGIAGELHIGGVGLARGYHNRPDLTAEKFIPDRFSPEPGARLYRTGDLARRRADGAIEFLGRMDHQVKIRGFRIELGEIEAWLLDHPAVREAVVVAREDHSGQKRLVAYVVGLSASGRSEVDELREWLAERLPDYMAPSFILALDALPLNPNGKVDRRALPAPDLSTIKQREYVAPRTDAERILAEIWGQVLHLDAIGVHDNFFELGGDSIVTLQIVARAHQQGLKLTPRELFEYPTIAAAAAIAVPTGEAITSVQDVPVQGRPDVQLTEEEFRQLMEEIR